MNDSLKDKAIILTGCSRGLGQEITKVLLNHGAIVHGISRNLTPFIEDAKDKFPSRFYFYPFDLSKPASELIEWMKASLPLTTPFHGFVNNAAIAYDDLITNANPETLLTLNAVNLTAPQLITSHFLRNCLLHKTAGTVVHITSIAAKQGYSGLAFYAATKAGIEAFSKTTAREWGPRGIRSNCVAPGFLETEMSAGLAPEKRQQIYNRAALKRPASLTSVAETVAFLLSEKADSITGQVLNVDAGA